MSQKLIHAVMGTTGEYSDRREWPVAAYLEKRQAEKHVEKASSFARVEFARRRTVEANGFDPTEFTNPWDAQMDMDYTGTGYSLLSVPILDWNA